MPHQYSRARVHVLDGPFTLGSPVGIGGTTHTLVNNTISPQTVTGPWDTGPSIVMQPGQVLDIWSNNVTWQVIPSVATLVPTVTTPARTLNTNFTPHATRPVLGIYSVRIAGVTTLLSGDEGRIELRADAGAPATPRGQVGMRVAQNLGVTVGTQSAVEGELTFLFPPGWQGRLHTVTVLAAPTFSIVRQTEIVL
jgi:hypothetical protein